MELLPATYLACPLDGAPLARVEDTLRCPQGHSFDRARQGYVNLLPVQHKRSRDPGDSREMVEARSRFLDAGTYAPISDTLNRLVLAQLADVRSPCILDAGCGEGYYLHRLALAMAAGGVAAGTLIGLDIAKPAIVAAARRSRAINWVVASNRNPPLLPASVDLVICMFGFPDYGAFARVLKPGGRLLLVDAGPDHLLELRQVIYPEVRRSEPPSIDKAVAGGFELVGSERLRHRTADLDPMQIADLLLMTPHLFRATHAGKAAAARLERLQVSVEVCLRTLSLNG